MRFALPLAILLGIALTACANEADVDVTGLDVSEVRNRAVEAMEKLESYRVVLSVAGSQLMTVDFERPNQYRTVSQSGPSNKPDDSDANVAELLYVGDRILLRLCAGIDEGCGPWEERPRGDVVMGASSAAFWPQWPIVALEMIEDAEVIDAPRINGVETVRIGGTVNMIRAVLESQRRVLETLDLPSLSRECITLVEFMDEEEAPETPQPSPTQTCRDLTFEETLTNEDGVAFQDENPPTVDLWISPDDGRLHRITITGPFGEGDEPSTMTFEYSQFNDVVIEAPEIEEDTE